MELFHWLYKGRYLVTYPFSIGGLIMKINNINIVQPSEMTVEIQKVGSDIQAFSGKITTDLIATKRIITCKWSGLLASEMATILTQLDNNTVSVRYFDPKQGQELTKTFIPSGLSAPAYSLVSGKEIWNELTVTLTEQG